LLAKFDRILILIGKDFILVRSLLFIQALVGLDSVVVLQFQPESISAYAQAHAPLSNGPEDKNSAKGNLSYEDICLAVAACLDAGTKSLFGG
jgi:hypothetical protein